MDKTAKPPVVFAPLGKINSWEQPIQSGGPGGSKFTKIASSLNGDKSERHEPVIFIKLRSQRGTNAALRTTVAVENRILRRRLSTLNHS